MEIRESDANGVRKGFANEVNIEVSPRGWVAVHPPDKRKGRPGSECRKPKGGKADCIQGLAPHVSTWTAYSTLSKPPNPKYTRLWMGGVVYDTVLSCYIVPRLNKCEESAAEGYPSGLRLVAQAGERVYKDRWKDNWERCGITMTRLEATTKQEHTDEQQTKPNGCWWAMDLEWYLDENQGYKEPKAL